MPAPLLAGAAVTPALATRLPLSAGGSTRMTMHLRSVQKVVVIPSDHVQLLLEVYGMLSTNKPCTVRCASLKVRQLQENVFHVLHQYKIVGRRSIPHHILSPL
jgi:hypothetical protein